VFAILTEVIQIFVPGRDGTIKDVLLDYSGYLIAFIISIAIYITYKKVKSKNSKVENTNSQAE
jgi:VanZ family protein